MEISTVQKATRISQKYRTDVDNIVGDVKKIRQNIFLYTNMPKATAQIRGERKRLLKECIIQLKEVGMRMQILYELAQNDKDEQTKKVIETWILDYGPAVLMLEKEYKR